MYRFIGACVVGNPCHTHKHHYNNVSWAVCHFLLRRCVLCTYLIMKVLIKVGRGKLLEEIICNFVAPLRIWLATNSVDHQVPAKDPEQVLVTLCKDLYVHYCISQPHPNYTSLKSITLFPRLILSTHPMQLLNFNNASSKLWKLVGQENGTLFFTITPTILVCSIRSIRSNTSTSKAKTGR